jgi:putative Flp pilus-assembly TadE/G-like protein/von Willebrand factor type A domain-containing protein
MLRRHARDEEGQAIVIAVFFMVVLLGFCALALDVGHAYLTTRHLQASVDAAALAGAQVLPDVVQANARATEYGPAGLNVPGDAQNVVATFTTKCLASAPGCSPANAIVVKATADVPTVFGGLFGVPSFAVHATATACSPCGQKPLDVMLVLDRTGSMCTDSSGHADPSCTDLNNARDGMKTFLGLMDPSIDHVGLAVLPPPTSIASRCSKPSASSYNSQASPYVIVPLSNDYLLTDRSLNPSSDLVSTIDCVQGAGSTAYANALEAAQAELVAHGRPGVSKVIVFLSDGAANTGPGYYPASSPYRARPCYQGGLSAQVIKSAGTALFSIGYDLEHDVCRADTGALEQPSITARVALQQIASTQTAVDRPYFYEKPDPGQLNTIFSNIAADLLQGTSRLMDDDA